MKISKLLFYWGFFQALFLIFSCSKVSINEKISDPSKGDNFVSLSEAKSLVAAIQDKPNTNSTKLQQSAERNISTNQGKSIKNTISIPDGNGNDAYHIINYNEGGFIILSADRRTDPILAFSDRNTFSFEEEYYPSGLVGWLKETKEYVEGVRQSGTQQSDAIALAWEPSSIQKFMSEIPPEDPGDGWPCGPPNSVVYGPLLETNWGQGSVG